MKNKLLFISIGIVLIILGVFLIKNKSDEKSLIKIDNQKISQVLSDDQTFIEKNFSEIKSVYQKDGKYFIDLDYVNRATCDKKNQKYKIESEGIDTCPNGFLEAAGSGNPIYENNNPTIRTFEITESVKIILIKYINEEQKQIAVSREDLLNYTHDNTNGYYKVQTYEVETKNGELTSLKALYEA